MSVLAAQSPKERAAIADALVRLAVKLREDGTIESVLLERIRKEVETTALGDTERHFKPGPLETFTLSIRSAR